MKRILVIAMTAFGWLVIYTAETAGTAGPPIG